MIRVGNLPILLEHHVDNPKIGPALGSMVDAGRVGQLFLEAVQEKALNKEEALSLAERFEVAGSCDTKPQALAEVGRKITQRKADHDRRQF